MTETQMVTALLRKIKQHAYAYKASDKFVAGIPDVIGCHNGRFFGVEAKVDYNTASSIQIYTMALISKNGGYCGVITYNNKGKQWWLKGEAYTLSGVVAQLMKRIGEGGNDVTDG